MAAPTLITDAELEGLIKRVYNNFREKVQNLSTPLLSQLEKAKAGGARNLRWGGAGAYWNVVVGRPSGGTFSDDGYFPPDQTAREVQATTGVKRAYVTREIDGLAIAGTQSKEAAFQTLARKTMEEIRDAYALMMQAAVHGAGNGVLATVGTSSNTTTIIVSSPYGVASAGQGGLLLNVNDYIAIRSSDGVTLRGRATISSITNSGDNATIVYTPGIAGVAANDVIVKATASDDAYNNAINGLINITHRGGSYASLHGVTASTYAIWDAVRMVAGTDTPDAATPTESDIWTLIQRVAGRSGKDAMLRPQEFLLMTTPGLGQKLMESVVSQRRFDAADFQKTVKGGYKAFNCCGLDLFMDYYVPAGTIYLIHKPSLAFVDAADFSPVQYEGTGAWRWLNGRDAFQTTYKSYTNLATLARNTHGSITGYTDTTRFTHVA